MASVSIRMKKTSNVSGRVVHDFRKRIPEYADPSRDELNAILLGQTIEQNTLRQDLEQLHLEKSGRRRRKDSALIWEGIITFSSNADLTNREAFDQAAFSLLKKIAEKHGFNEPLWLVRHEDESRPHYHFAFANAHAETAKPIRLSPYDMQQLQNLAGECFKHLGLTRGKPKEQRIEDDEPTHKWINRSVRQLHNDLPKEIKALQQHILELTEKERKTTERLEKTLHKLQETENQSKKLQKRLETYQRRLETTQKELNQAQSEIERLKKLIETQKPEPTQIQYISEWKEKRFLMLFKRKEPVLKSAKVISLKAAEESLLATRKAAKEEAEQKAKQAVQDEITRLRRRIQALLQSNQELEQAQEQNAQYQIQLLEAIQKASKQKWLSSAKPEYTWRKEQNPPEITYYNTTLLDYETKLVAVGDASPIQQAAALYRTSKEKGWKQTIFQGLNENQIEWLVEAARRDHYNIDFEENWAKEYAEKVRRELEEKQLKADIHHSPSPS